MATAINNPKFTGQFLGLQFACRKAATLTAVNSGGDTTAILGATAVRSAGSAALTSGAVSESIGTDDYFVTANVAATLTAVGIAFGVGPVTGAVAFTAGNFLASFFFVSGICYLYNPALTSSAIGRPDYTWPAARYGILRRSNRLHYMVPKASGEWMEVGADTSTSAAEHQVHIVMGNILNAVADVEIWIP